MPNKDQKKKTTIKAKPNYVKPLNHKIPTYKQKLQFDVEKSIKPDKINPNKIFDTKKKLKNK